MRRSRAGPAFGILAAGVGLRVWHWLADRSLWQDEARLARNVVEGSWAELLEPLRFQQAAPPGFLVLEKASAALFGANEFALRLGPLLAACAALPVFHRLALRCLDTGRANLASLLFALSPALVYYAAELKPYSFDVLAAAVLLLAALRFEERQASRAATAELAVTGVLALLASYGALFALAGAAAWLAGRALRAGQGRARLALCAVAGAWLAGLAALGALSLGELARNPALRAMWASGFPPLPPASAEQWLWYPRAAFGLLENLFALPTQPAPTAQLAAGLGLASLLAGAARLARDAPWTLALLVLPGAAAAGAASLGLYPFEGRVILFLVPMTALLVAAPWTGALPRLAAAAALALLTTWPLLHWLADPEREALRPVLQALRQHPAGAAPIYVHRSARPAFAFYTRYREDCRPPGAETVEGRALGRGAPADALAREIGRMAGFRRFWLVFAHSWPWSPDARERALEQAARFAVERDAILARNASAHLFERISGE